MEPGVLYSKLIRAARKDAPSEAVPYAFTGRVLAAIRAHPAADPWAAWSAALWRAVAPCAVVALLLAAWTAWTPEAATLGGEEFAQHFENTVLAGAVDPSFE